MYFRSSRSVFAFAFTVILAGIFCLHPYAANAQTFRGSINGTATDQAGAVVAGAEIVAINDGTQVSHTTITSSGGEFAFQDLPLGTYTVTATASGFQTIKFEKVSVAAGAVYTLPVKLSVASQATTVEVSAAALALDTTTVTQTTVLSEKTVQDLPLNGRDFTQMAGLTPGYSGYTGGGYGSLNGTRANQMNWQIDGVDNNDLWHNIPAVNQGGVSGIAGVVMPIDALAEFSVQTQAAPEAGRNPGGTVNLSLKSGTNDIHGSLYYYNRNEFFGAGSPLTPGEKQKVRNYNYGVSAGGPFIKNKLFWFTTYEHQRFVIGLPGLGTEPSGAYQAEAQQLLAANEVSVNPVSQNLLNMYWPAYSLSGPAAANNYHSPDPEFGYSYNGLVKIDWNINDKNTLSVRGFGGQGNQVAPVGSQLLPYYEIAPLHVFNYAVVYNHVFTPSLTNQVLAGVNYFNQLFSDYSTAFDINQTGLVTNSPFPQAPNIVITGFDQIGLTPPQGRNDITGHLTDDLAWTIGKHQFKFGGEYRQAQLDEFYHRHTQGIFNFDGSLGPTPYTSPTATWGYTGNDPAVPALADFLAGNAKSSSISQGDPDRQVFVNTFTLFAQDAWQLTPALNVNYGIRYDYIGPFHNDYQNLSVFRPEIGGNGIAFQGNQIENLFNRTWTNFSPRVGFSFKATPETVVRGGFGMYFDSYNLNPFLDNRPGNLAPNGVEGNPAGNNPVFTVEQGPKTFAAGQSYFPSSAGNLACLQNTDPSCGTFGVFSVDKNFRPSYDYNFNFNVEQSLGTKAVFTLGYVGTLGRHLLSLIDINQAALNANGLTQSTRPYYSDISIQPYALHYGDINQMESIGTSNYHSLQATFRTNSWHGLTSQVAYTLSHSLDQVTAYRGALPQNSIATGSGCGPVSNAGFACDYGNSDFDTRNTGIVQFTYAVPGMNRWKGFTHGWEVSSLMNFHGGQPFNVTTSSDTTGTDNFVQRPDLVGNATSGFGKEKAGASWLNPDAFATPAAGTFGTLRRNAFYGPGYSDVDLSVFKNTAIKERVTVQFRAEMFNLFNRANYAPPASISNNFVLNDTIGDYNGSPGIGAGEPFNTQLALKVIF